jgi:sulfopyruvate decarboxylase beta subunit
LKDEKILETSGEKRDIHEIQGAHLTRYDIIKIISPYLDGKVVVSNLGWPSKELYAIKHQPSNFYMLGSMGMVTPIGLGIALSSRKEVVVIDGDGSLLMNPGTLATAAAAAPENLTIVAIDNGAYGSTGNQPTLAASCVDLEQVARGFGFRNTMKVAGEKALVEVMMGTRKGPAFIHVLALPGNKDVPNIPLHHLEIKKQVQGFLKT